MKKIIFGIILLLISYSTFPQCSGLISAEQEFGVFRVERFKDATIQKEKALFTFSQKKFKKEKVVFLDLVEDKIYLETNQNTKKAFTDNENMFQMENVIKLMLFSTEKLLFSEYLPWAEKQYNRANKEVVFVLNHNALLNDNFDKVEFSNTENLYIISKSNNFYKLKSNDLGKNKYLIEIEKNLYLNVSNFDVEKTIEAYKKHPINYKDLRVLSLVKNNATDKTIDELFGNKKLKFNFTSKNEFFDLIKANQSKLLYIVAHIENGNIITYDSKKTKIFSITIDEYVDFVNQLEFKINVRLFGCQTVEFIDHGTLNMINSIKTCQTLYTSVIKSTNDLELHTNMVNENLQLVIPKRAEGTNINPQIYIGKEYNYHDFNEKEIYLYGERQNIIETKKMELSNKIIILSSILILVLFYFGIKKRYIKK